jgi:hypothetical protein
MQRAIPPLPNTSSWCGDLLRTGTTLPLPSLDFHETKYELLCHAVYSLTHSINMAAVGISKLKARQPSFNAEIGVLFDDRYLKSMNFHYSSLPGKPKKLELGNRGGGDISSGWK